MGMVVVVPAVTPSKVTKPGLVNAHVCCIEVSITADTRAMTVDVYKAFTPDA